MHLGQCVLYGGLVRWAFAGYAIKDTYDSSNWADSFSFDTLDDPTLGYVNFVDQDFATKHGMFDTKDDVVTFGADHNSTASGRGRNSVRLSSKKTYTHGLVIVDLAHMPANTCGSWNAFWMYGADWPNDGEIDIAEGVNSQEENWMTAHTSKDCTLGGADCAYPGPGCLQTGGGPKSYGAGFNKNQGGFYAMEWTSHHIFIWFFGRGDEPKDLTDGSPDPSKWGEPIGNFDEGIHAAGCDIDAHFRNQNIIFDTTFCGVWAGETFLLDQTCAALNTSCVEYVMNHPAAFEESYWAVNSLKVYEFKADNDKADDKGDDMAKDTKGDTDDESSDDDDHHHHHHHHHHHRHHRHRHHRHHHHHSANATSSVAN